MPTISRCNENDEHTAQLSDKVDKLKFSFHEVGKIDEYTNFL